MILNSILLKDKWYFQRSTSGRSDKDVEAAGSLALSEIRSIPPLPLYALLDADKDVSTLHAEMAASYVAFYV